MPVKIRKIKTKSGKKSYRVSTPNSVKSYGSTLANALAQERLLNAVEHSNWKPDGSHK